jgi:hypothetical protein
MFKDIEKTIGLAKNPQLGAPNFLLALGLCCFTEYWDRLLTGTAKNNGGKCFNAFFDRWGQPYVDQYDSNLCNKGADSITGSIFAALSTYIQVVFVTFFRFIMLF